MVVVTMHDDDTCTRIHRLHGINYDDDMHEHHVKTIYSVNRGLTAVITNKA